MQMKEKEKNMAKRNNHYLVTSGNSVVFVGRTRDTAEFLGILPRYVSTYASRTICIDGKYFVFKFSSDAMIMKHEILKTHGYSEALASCALMRVDMLRRNLLRAIERHDHETIDMIDRYARACMTSQKLENYLYENGWRKKNGWRKRNEHD